MKQVIDIKVELGPPKHHWMRFDVSGGGRTFGVDASYVPFDWFHDLVGGVALIAKGGVGGDEIVVAMAENPGVHDLLLRRTDEGVLMTVTAYDDLARTAGERVFEWRGARLALCLAFWRAFRRLESQISPAEFEREWGGGLPTEKISEIGEHVKVMIRASS